MCKRCETGYDQFIYRLADALWNQAAVGYERVGEIEACYETHLRVMSHVQMDAVDAARIVWSWATQDFGWATLRRLLAEGCIAPDGGVSRYPHWFTQGAEDTAVEAGYLDRHFYPHLWGHTALYIKQ